MKTILETSDLATYILMIEFYFFKSIIIWYDLFLLGSGHKI